MGITCSCNDTVHGAGLSAATTVDDHVAISRPLPGAPARQIDNQHLFVAGARARVLSMPDSYCAVLQRVPPLHSLSPTTLVDMAADCQS